MAEATARELNLSLEEALHLTALYALKDRPRFDRAAMRPLERPSATRLL